MGGGVLLRVSLDGLELRLGDAPEVPPDAPEAREALVRRLCGDLAPAWPVPAAGRDALGRPVCLPPHAGFGLSFSRHGGRLWAACAPRPGIGVDAEGPESFAGDYADAHAFAPAELAAARALCATLAEARALVWCLKEAAAKALGTGFHSLDPRDLHVAELAPAEPGALTTDAAAEAGSPLRCRVGSPRGGLCAAAFSIGGVRLAAAAVPKEQQ